MQDWNIYKLNWRISKKEGKWYVSSVNETTSLDINSNILHHFAMPQHLPYAEIELDNTVRLGKGLSLAENFDTGYVLKIDLK